MWERFVSKINFAADNGCWEWTGATNASGYGICGKLIDGQHRNLYAHRLGMHIAKRPVPEGMTVDHLCRNTSCVNPEHLDIVTAAENIFRSDSIPAKNKRKTHCVRGHEFTPENTYKYYTRRMCRTCRRVAKLAWMEDHQDA